MSQLHRKDNAAKLADRIETVQDKMQPQQLHLCTANHQEKPYFRVKQLLWMKKKLFSKVRVKNYSLSVWIHIQSRRSLKITHTV